MQNWTEKCKFNFFYCEKARNLIQIYLLGIMLVVRVARERKERVNMVNFSSILSINRSL